MTATTAPDVLADAHTRMLRHYRTANITNQPENSQ